MNSIAYITLTFILIILATSLAHWTLVRMYALWCSPQNISGAFKSLFTLGSPFCQFINYLQFELSKHYITIWGTAGLALFAFLAGKLTIQTK